MTPPPAVPHGGDLASIRQRFPAAPGPWIDLSTGINPWPYPVPEIGPAAWTRLPGETEMRALTAAAADYYGAPSPGHVAAAPGSQALIQWLPRLRPPGRVAILGPTYGEHEQCWRTAGHDVTTVTALTELDRDWDVAVLVNPNNPDGRRVAPAALCELGAGLGRRGGWLVVDEAFADVAPETSAAGLAGPEGLVVLRSFGKFFGLAGVRLGFAIAPPALARTIRTALGPWAVAGPAAAVATAAFRDVGWISATRRRLDAAAKALRRTIEGAGLTSMGGTDLYQLLSTRPADRPFDRLAAAGIYARAFPDRPDWLRLGLPPDEAAAARLAAALPSPRAAAEASHPVC